MSRSSVIVDAVRSPMGVKKGNLVGIQQNQQITLLETPEAESPFLSIGGGSSFDIGAWLNNLWKQVKEAFK